MRLYFSIVISHPPKGSHPHGPNNAWMWFTRVLNLIPEPDITATMVYDFLQVMGCVLMKEYNKQFIKLLIFVFKEKMTKLKEVSTPAGSGSLSRLQLELEKGIRGQGHLPMPEGYLEKGFWFS